jgi:hypothetical protein
MVTTVNSEERGKLTIVAVAVSAQGTFISPVLLFPTKHFRDHFIRDGQDGCVGVSTVSLWIKEDVSLYNSLNTSFAILNLPKMIYGAIPGQTFDPPEPSGT